MKTDMVPQNVAMKVDRPRKNSFQPTFLDAEQMQKLFEVVKGTRLELPVLVAAFYGLRRGEVLGLKWDAIDFNRGTLTIKRTVTEATIDGAMKIIEQDSAKTKSSLRTLPLVGSFRDYFQKVKEAQELNKKVCGNCYNYDYDGYVFVNELGERMRPNYLTEYFPKYIAKHGMPKMRFHDLRHSCASLLLANGVPLKQIQEWLGHSDFSTTANIYAHLDYRSKISSAQAMEQGMLLPRSDDFGSRWENVTEQDKITEPDLNPGFLLKKHAVLTQKRPILTPFQRENRKIQGVGQKRKVQQTLELTGLFWRRGWDSNPCAIARKLISSVVYHWQIRGWSRSLRAASSNAENPGAARSCGHSDLYLPEAF